MHPKTRTRASLCAQYCISCNGRYVAARIAGTKKLCGGVCGNQKLRYHCNHPALRNVHVREQQISRKSERFFYVGFSVPTFSYLFVFFFFVITTPLPRISSLYPFCSPTSSSSSHCAASAAAADSLE